MAASLPFLAFDPEVREALRSGRAVVALESTIIAHGLPFPVNLETALAVEDVVRAAGAVPATIAVIHGKAKVGCSREEIELLARAEAAGPGERRGAAAPMGPAATPVAATALSGGTSPGCVPPQPIAKASLRDLPVLYARGGYGATTVAATATIAAQAGIRVFVTGGIGGVHRGWQDTLDVSADLEVLARLPLAAVCSGAKSILDIGATLEYLETKGVTVVGLGTDRFPGFHVRRTEFPVDAACSTPEEAASVAYARFAAGLPGSVIIAVPAPEEEALDPASLEPALARALEAAKAAGVKGKALTPYLLAALERETAGRSLAANLGLIKRNAAVGAAVALELARLSR